MNGIKYIREKSNISKSELAGRMGVTRQSITLWESGKRNPRTKHLKWLADFYGIDGKWFSELSEDDLFALNKMRMYQYIDCDKEYYIFVSVIRPLAIHEIILVGAWVKYDKAGSF